MSIVFLNLVPESTPNGLQAFVPWAVLVKNKLNIFAKCCYPSNLFFLQTHFKIGKQ